MSAAELVIMASAISASLAVMIALVFFAEHQSNNQRPRSSERPAIRPHADNHVSGPAHELSRQTAESPEHQPAVPQP
jgi:hypothetical protein